MPLVRHDRRGKTVAAGIYIVKMNAFDLKEKPLGAFEQRITVLPR